VKVERLHVRSEELAIIQDILGRLIPDCEVWAFGSRVSGRIKKFSDLDLVILGNDSLPLGTMVDLADAFTESDLPYKVDLVDWASTSERFRTIIVEAYKVVQQPLVGAPEPHGRVPAIS
jgi:predicted nucleotidyltransferase